MRVGLLPSKYIMKKIDITFEVRGCCGTEINVPDDFQIPLTNSHDVWKLLCESFPDHFYYLSEDLSRFDAFYETWEGEMKISNLVFSATDGFKITDKDGNETEVID